MAVTIYEVCALPFMMVMYAMERRGRGFVLAFAFGCVLSGRVLSARAFGWSALAG